MHLQKRKQKKLKISPKNLKNLMSSDLFIHHLMYLLIPRRNKTAAASKTSRICQLYGTTSTFSSRCISTRDIVGLQNSNFFSKSKTKLQSLRLEDTSVTTHEIYILIDSSNKMFQIQKFTTLFLCVHVHIHSTAYDNTKAPKNVRPT